MRKIIYPFLMLTLVTFAISCQKNAISTTASTDLTKDEKAMIASAGFNGNWAEKTAAGYLIENDILLTSQQLTEMAGAKPTNNLIVADEEHYRTYNLVAVSGASRTITVSLSGTFPSYYSTALNNSLARYNSYGLKLNFQRVSSGGNIVITGRDLGTSGGGCILGQSSGFPTSNGNPASGFTLSTSSCATAYINTVDKADEVIAHEIGHCIGFRHTDYKRRASCGPGPGESAGSVGAVHIAGTPTNVSGSYNSWMMACTNGSPSFSSADVTALNVVY